MGYEVRGVRDGVFILGLFFLILSRARLGVGSGTADGSAE